ncbi:CD276 antigen-like [Xiphophorus maculatus]|uniref:CD276 antigen-like n=1 Tax=Xiphophorus maculatus TaxID=8083 RepID=UPI000C6DC97E|nr:CD276 antigen-like [Xiphophorus maculatus]
MAEKSVLKTLLVLVLVLVLVPLLAVTEADPEVSCVFRQNCLLPCQIQFNSDLVIHWSNASSAGDSVVHSYYDGQDQLGQQNQNFKDRTSLIQDQISRGNASLLLKEVKIQDEGRYKCNTSTSTGHKESFINLKIDAPVSTIRIHQDGNRITCSSEGIYPPPELTWSTEPPSNTALPTRTTVHQTEEKLYDISSSLTVPDGSDRIYSCTIRTRRNIRMETLKKKDAEISCNFKQSCILPCSFQSYGEPILHWTQLESSELRVHSYYDNQDQLGPQNENFRGRTSLFQDQISRGNASLLLREVQLQDQGRYSCYISTIKGHEESIIRLSVDAPVSDIRIHQDGNRITCSSEGIYPQPELTWSTEPPSNTTLQNRTTVHQTEEKLYDISSSLTVPDGSDRIYSCTIRTRRNQRRATFRKLSSVTVTTDETTLPCSGLNGSVMTVVWRFNHQTVLNQTGRNRSVSERWRKHVKDVSEHGDLSLQGLDPDLEGNYSCETSNKDETMVTQITVRRDDKSSWIIWLVIGIIFMIVIFSSLLYFCCKR